MPAADPDLAFTASEEAVKDALKHIVVVYLRALESSATDAARAEAKQRFQNALKFYRDAYQDVRSVIDIVLPAS